MIWLDKKTSKGVLKYRMPNILEAYDILDDSGFSSGVTSPLKLKRNIVKILSPLVDIESIEGANNYEDLLSMLDEMSIPLSEIADEVMTKAFGAFRKKA